MHNDLFVFHVLMKTTLLPYPLIELQLCMLFYRLFVQARSLDEAQCVLVVPSGPSGSPAIVPLHKRALMTEEQAQKQQEHPSAAGDTDIKAAVLAQAQAEAWLQRSPVSFVFHSSTYLLDRAASASRSAAASAATGGGCRLVLFHMSCISQRVLLQGAPVLCWCSSGWTRPTASYCPRTSAGADGHRARRRWPKCVIHLFPAERMWHVTLLQAKWGLNSVDMPSPRFLELLLERALAPFFVFQVRATLTGAALLPKPHAASADCLRTFVDTGRILVLLHVHAIHAVWPGSHPGRPAAETAE